jgi:SEC-C motif-containing protein
LISSRNQPSIFWKSNHPFFENFAVHALLLFVFTITTTITMPSQHPRSFFFFLISLLTVSTTFGFQHVVALQTTLLRPRTIHPLQDHSRGEIVRLSAKKKAKNKKTPTRGGAGFGGAAKEVCACGSAISYDMCCGMLHRDANVFAAATPDQVVRARYTAYSKRVVDFILASTHPEHPSFSKDMKHWRETIEKDSYDAFELCKCEILETSVEGELAKVRFLAHMTERATGERTAFIETSTFERDPTSKAWLYRDGVVQTVEE